MANLVIKNNNNTDASLTFDRGTNANWQVTNSSGNLIFSSDWDSSKRDYFQVFTMNHTTGNAIFHKGTVTASSFIGDLDGNAATATQAENDGDGKKISATYWKSADLVEATSTQIKALFTAAAKED